MPELPEVETVVKGLRRSVVGYSINSLHFSSKKLRLPFQLDMVEEVIGGQIINVYRKAKYILINLDNGISLVIHLGMSGKLRASSEYSKQKHDHAVLELISAFSPSLYMILNDPRRFGLIIAIPTAEVENHKLFLKMGAEPLDAEFSSQYLFNKCQNRVTTIKNLIMDNNVVVGVGNIYASESLFLARINPLISSKDLTYDECKKLVLSIRSTLNKAIESGGSTLRDYSQLSGEAGRFQHLFKVYGRKGEPCYECSTLIKSSVISGRNTYYCPKCQKI